jgi:NTP pyrophosphatase (non-canonical NTP hydrolase)
MHTDDYQEAITRTCTITDRQDLIKLALIGLAGELGEIADPLKKHLWQGHELDLAHLREEIGDCMWYLCTLCNALGINLSVTLIMNIAKLAARYPDGFSPERSVHRATDIYDHAESRTGIIQE